MNNEYDTLIDAARKAYDAPIYARGMSVERDWSADGKELLSDARCPYTKVRFVKTYDAAEWLRSGELIPVGTMVEIW